MSNAAPIRQAFISHMDQALERLRKDLTGLRTGRASVALLDGIRVDYYGTMTPLKQIANVSTPEARIITIQPWEPKLIKEIEKAISSSGLGVTPSNDGKVIRVPLPPLTEERRKEIVKRLHHIVEEHRVALRNVRRDANEHMKKLLKDKTISEDDERRGLDEMQKMTDAYIAKVDATSKGKEKEIMGV